MAKVTIEYDSDVDAETLIAVMKANKREDRVRYGIKIIRKEPDKNHFTLSNGMQVKLTKRQGQYIGKLSSAARRTVIIQRTFFKAQGTFKNSSPDRKSPYLTATPFYSNHLGSPIKNGFVSLEDLHETLSRKLNDRHAMTGEIGDWRVTHARKYGGYWSYRYQTFVSFNFPFGKKKRNLIVSDIAKSSE